MPVKLTDKAARATLQEAVKTVAKLQAFPRPLTTQSLHEIELNALKATNTELLHAKKDVHHMEDKLRLILIGGTTVTLLGLMALPLGFWISGIIFSTGVGIIGGSALLGYQTGVFKTGKALQSVPKHFLNTLSSKKAPIPPEDEFQSATVTMMLKDSFASPASSSLPSHEPFKRRPKG